MSGTRGLDIVSNAADVLGMGVVRGMKGAGRVCDMCMCLARGGVGGEESERIKGLGLGFSNRVGTGGVLAVHLYLGGGGAVAQVGSG